MTPKSKKAVATGGLVVLCLMLAITFVFAEDSADEKYMLFAQKTADEALSYFLEKDYDSLYELNHSATKKAITREQMKDYVDNMSPADTKECKGIKGFFIGKFSEFGYSCLTFDIELKFKNRTSVARVSVAKDGERWSVLHFTFFPSVEKK